MKSAKRYNQINKVRKGINIIKVSLLLSSGASITILTKTTTATTTITTYILNIIL